MGTVTVEAVNIVPLKRIGVEGGDVMHAMKNSDPGYKGFGEAYFSWVACGYVKAWKLHTRMTLNLLVPVGEVRFVFVSPDKPERYRVEDIGTSSYSRITVPPGLWFGFQGLSESDSLVLNLANIIHDPAETVREKISFFPYKWVNNHQQ